MKRLIFATLIAFFYIGCGGGGSSDSSQIDTENLIKSTSLSSTYNGANNIIKLSNYADNFNYKLDLGSYKKNVYLIFTNPNNYYNASKPNVINKNTMASLKTVMPNKITKEIKNEIKEQKSNHIPEKILSYNENPPRLKNRLDNKINKKVVLNKSYLYEGSVFYDYNNQPLKASCQKITTINGKTLSIWVEDKSLEGSCSKSKCITQEMIEALSNSFLQAGDNNDIYDWVHNILGEEWEDRGKSNLIPDNDEISILLLDIDSDDSLNGGVVGFFYSKDNYTKSIEPYSNQRVMFYIDSVMYANGDGYGWGIDDKWPKEVIITLAHEFQHMIHFYQKYIKQNLSKNSSTWINEMCSSLIEDLLADKLKSIGPRQVDYYDESAGIYPITNGKLADFNQYNYISLTSWYDNPSSLNEENNAMNSYAITYSFGAYLARNYGGASLLRDILYNPYTDQDSILYAVNRQPNGANKTFSDLLKEWGISVLLSDDKYAPKNYRYNSGNWFISYYNGIEYKLGSINMYNYYPNPTIFTNSHQYNYSNAGIYPHSNTYYLVGQNLTGEINLDISLYKNVGVSVVIK